MIGINAIRIASMTLGRTPVTKPIIADGVFERNLKNWTLSVKYMMLLRLPTRATGRDQKTIMAATKVVVAANRTILSRSEIPIFDQMISAGLGAKVRSSLNGTRVLLICPARWASTRDVNVMNAELSSAYLVWFFCLSTIELRRESSVLLHRIEST
jgi:hypothetical protein